MFAEDLGIVPDDVLRRVLEGLIKDPKRSSADDLGQLFQYLAERDPRPPSGSIYGRTPFANGGLFEHPARVHLSIDELITLRAACDLDWASSRAGNLWLDPPRSPGKEKQWALGAHYTSEADIMKAVRPTVVEPWHERIEQCRSAAEAEAAWRDLMNYVVLDPACGSGNFLYIAYRELRRIEARLRERLAELRAKEGIAPQEEMEFFPVSNMKGIEIELFAVELAHVVLWMGHKLASDEMKAQGVSEPDIPLGSTSLESSAAMHCTSNGRARTPLGGTHDGSNRLRAEVGDKEIEWLTKTFGIGVKKDYAVYWFRKAHDRLEPGGRADPLLHELGHANRNRTPSLEWIAETGGVITNAISNKNGRETRP